MSHADMMQEINREVVYLKWAFDAGAQAWADLLWRQWIETGAV